MNNENTKYVKPGVMHDSKVEHKVSVSDDGFYLNVGHEVTVDHKVTDGFYTDCDQPTPWHDHSMKPYSFKLGSYKPWNKGK